jgi:hypothetical protein
MTILTVVAEQLALEDRQDLADGLRVTFRNFKSLRDSSFGVKSWKTKNAPEALAPKHQVLSEAYAHALASLMKEILPSGTNQRLWRARRESLDQYYFEHSLSKLKMPLYESEQHPRPKVCAIWKFIGICVCQTLS